MTASIRPLTILDATLREGEQAAGVCFSKDEKIYLVNQLKNFGVSLIEIGHPGISQVEEQLCKQICDAVSDVALLVHARACENDVLAAKNTGASWVGIWVSYNDISLVTKFPQKSREWIDKQVHSSISFAKKSGMKVRFTIEDASRTEWESIAHLGAIAVEAGADHLSLADTVGIWHPKTCFEIVQKAVSYFPCPIEVHLHNDLGLAQANAVAAMDAGASVIDASILGIGERAGICDLFSLSATMEKFYSAKRYHWEFAQPMVECVSRIAQFNTEPHHPLIGKQVFSHVSKYHLKAMTTDPCAYEALEPEDYAASRKMMVNPLERNDARRFEKHLNIQAPFIKGASELAYHRDGVGNRWVLMDNRIDERSTVYAIERIFDKDYAKIYQPHVDSHAHHCDSFFVFMGNNEDGTGLTVSVTFGEGDERVTKIFSSPASVFIPAKVPHTYSYLNGIGRFLNVVLAGNYNQSLV